MLQLQFPIVFWIVVGLLVVAIVLTIIDKASPYSMGDWMVGAAITYVLAGIMLIVLVVLAIPFNSKYWVITHTSGTIQTVSSAISSDAWGNVGTTYTLTIDGRQYIVEDTRASLLRVGNHVDLACTDQWNYGAKDQLNCVIGAGK